MQIVMKVESNLVALQCFISHLSSEVEMPSLMRIKLSPSSLSPLSSSCSKGLWKTSEYLAWLTRFHPARTSCNRLILSQDSDSNLEKSWAWFVSMIPLLALPDLPAKGKEPGREAQAGTGQRWKSCLHIWLCRAAERSLFRLRIKCQAGRGLKAAEFRRRS